MDWDSSPTARRLGVAGAALVLCSLLGGVVSVLSGVNTWADAWTADATLAAPWPMLVLQAVACLASVQSRRGPALAGSTVLALAAAVAGISGFFDGQLGRPDLGVAYVAMQVVYVVVAWATVALAALRVRRILAASSTSRRVSG
jgi:hypothetical protein